MKIKRIREYYSNFYIFYVIFLLPKFFFLSLVFPFLSKYNFQNIKNFFYNNLEYIVLTFFLFFAFLNDHNIREYYEFIVIYLLAYFIFLYKNEFDLINILSKAQLYLFLYILLTIFINNIIFKCSITRTGYLDLLFFINNFLNSNIGVNLKCLDMKQAHVSYFVGQNLILVCLNFLNIIITNIFKKKKNYLNIIILLFCMIASIYIGSRVLFILYLINFIIVTISLIHYKIFKLLIFNILFFFMICYYQPNMNLFNNLNNNSNQIILNDYHENTFKRFKKSKFYSPRYKEYLIFDQKSQKEDNKNFLNLKKGNIYHNYFLTIMARYSYLSILLLFFYLFIAIKLILNFFRMKNKIKLIYGLYLFNFFIIFNLTTLMGYSKQLFIIFFIILNIFNFKKSKDFSF